MPAKKKASPKVTENREEQELEYFILDEDSLNNLTEYMNNLSDTVDTLVSEVSDMRTDNDQLREQVEELERALHRARFNA